LHNQLFTVINLLHSIEDDAVEAELR
jgi:hypothetical protein